MAIQLFDLVSVSYQQPSGNIAEFTVRVDRAPTAPPAYQQIKTQIAAALNGADDDPTFEAIINDRYGIATDIGAGWTAANLRSYPRTSSTYNLLDYV